MTTHADESRAKMKRASTIDPRATLQAAPTSRGPRSLRTVLAALVAVAAPLVALGQSFLVHTYSVDDGLPSSDVYSVAQDEVGRMWFATRAGIVVYDGMTWETAPIPRPQPGATALHLAPDAHGSMWLTSTHLDSLLTVFAADDWNRIDVIEVYSCVSVLPVVEDQDLEVTALSVGELNGRTQVAMGLRQGGLILRRDERWEYLDTGDGLPPGIVRGIADYEGGFCVATDGGLCFVRDGIVDSSMSITLPQGAGPILAVAVARGDMESTGSDGIPALLTLDRTHLYLLGDGQATTLAAGFQLETYEPYPSVLLQDGAWLYFGQKHGLFQLDLKSGELTTIGRTNGLLADGATDLELDREGNLWVTSPRGVSKIVSQRFVTYRLTDGLLESEVSAVAERRNGEIILGHNTGLTILADSTMRTIRFSDPEPFTVSPPRVMDLLRDSRGRIWLAASRFGTGLLSDHDTITWYPPPDGKNQHSIFALLEADDGTLIAGGGGGLYRLRNGRYEAFGNLPEDIGGVRRLIRLHDGAVAAATSRAGLVILRNGVLQPVTHPETSGVLNAYTLFEDAQERLWVGTRAGLLTLEGGGLVEPAQVGLRVTDPVFMITQSPDHTLWFGTDDGVVMWNGGNARSFSLDEGLAGRETNRGGGFVDSKGDVWIGTETGVSIYQPDRDLRPASPPTVNIVGVVIDGEDLGPSPHRRLRHGANTVEFHIAGIGFGNEDELFFRCRLNGFDDQWSRPMAEHTRSVRYTNLPHGTYTLSVQARIGNGSWSWPIQSAPIAVNKPLWMAWWFVLVVFAVMGSVTFAVAKVISRWRYAHHLEREVLRRREAETKTAAALATLEESRASFASIVDENEDGLLVIDSWSTVRFANPAACRLLDLDRGALIGRPLLFLLGETPAREIRIPRPDGTEGTAEVRIKSTNWLGDPARLVVIRDVTVQRQAELQLLQSQKIEAVGRLAGGVAHDFNNLLQAVLSSVEMLKASIRGDLEQSELIDELEHQVEHGSFLTKQLLLFTRPDVPKKSVIDLNRVLDENLSLMRRLVRENVIFTLALGQADLHVDADKGQLTQVVTNLVVNACDAMPEGGTLTIRTGREGSEVVWFEVEDTGCGFPESNLKKIFEPFFSTKARNRGTGLGLSIVRRIIDEHNGHIDVQSTEGRGTVFRITLPATKTKPSAEVSNHRPSDLEQSVRGERILVVEDDEAIRQGLSDVLTRVGYEVLEASCAEEAEEIARNEDFDLLLADMVLPGKSGDALARSILERRPDTPIVMMSGYTDDASKRLAGRARSTRMLVKPFTIEHLKSTLRDALAQAAHPTDLHRPQTPSNNHRILIVEDNPRFRRLMARFLRQAGYEIEALNDGLAALESLSRSGPPFSLVVSDVDLPGLGGAKLYEKCITLHPGLPFLFCSGDADALASSTLENETRVSFIQKPFDLQRLLGEVERLIGPGVPHCD